MTFFSPARVFDRTIPAIEKIKWRVKQRSENSRVGGIPSLAIARKKKADPRGSAFFYDTFPNVRVME
jgi:hypothetical protein